MTFQYLPSIPLPPLCCLFLPLPPTTSPHPHLFPFIAKVPCTSRQRLAYLLQLGGLLAVTQLKQQGKADTVKVTRAGAGYHGQHALNGTEEEATQGKRGGVLPHLHKASPVHKPRKPTRSRRQTLNIHTEAHHTMITEYPIEHFTADRLTKQP